MRPSLFIIASIFASSVTLGQAGDFSDVDFSNADSIAGLYPMHPLNDLKILSDKLTRPLTTDVEKFRSIFKWVCTNTQSDYILFKQSHKNRSKLSGEALMKWEKEFSVRVFSVLVNEHRTICSGYAYLVKELAFHAGLKCKIVNGYGRSAHSNVGGKGFANHSWNAVQLNNKWYLSDPTWSSGMFDLQEGKFMGKFDDAYFLADPGIFARSHYPLDTSWLLMDDKPTLEDFLNGPLVYIGAFQFRLSPLFPDQFFLKITKGSKISFQFSNTDGKKLADTSLYIERLKTRDPFVTLQMGNELIYSADHTFSSKGQYAVHIVMDGAPVISYNVRVE